MREKLNGWIVGSIAYMAALIIVLYVLTAEAVRRLLRWPWF
jgi:hypothetical protein